MRSAQSKFHHIVFGTQKVSVFYLPLLTDYYIIKNFCSDDSNELEDNTLIDFDIGYLIRDVEGYHKGNLVMERARDLLSRSDFNFKDKIKSRMKGEVNFQICFE